MVPLNRDIRTHLKFTSSKGADKPISMTVITKNTISNVSVGNAIIDTK